MKFLENVYLNASALRTLCVEKGWYSRGTNEEYSHLLAMPYKKDGITPKKITMNTLYNMACDILIHSDMEEYYSCPIEETLESVMDEINKKCERFIHIIG